MSVEDRLHQIEQRIERLEKSYNRFLNSILKALGGDVDREVEVIVVDGEKN